jgi:class 3 adenylate cyclase
MVKKRLNPDCQSTWDIPPAVGRRLLQQATASDSVAAASIRGTIALEALGTRLLKGFDEAVPVFAVGGRIEAAHLTEARGLGA